MAQIIPLGGLGKGAEKLIYLMAVTSLFVWFIWWLLKSVSEVLCRPFALQRKMASQGVRGPPYQPFFGNSSQQVALLKEIQSKPMGEISHDIIPRVLPHFHTWSNLYGNPGKPILSWFGWKPTLLVMDPHLIKEVLSRDFSDFQKLPPRPEARQLVGQGLSVATDKTWAQHRRIISPAFHLKSLKGMIPTMVKCTEAMLARWEDEVKSGREELEMHAQFQSLTADVIAQTVFGSSHAEGKQVFKLQREQAILVSESLQFPYIPGYRFLPTPKNMQKWRLNREIRKVLSKVISEREKDMVDGIMEGFGKDLLSIMMSANRQAHKGISLSLEGIIDECKTFYFAGHETISNLLTWTMMLLGVHKEWQEKAREEVFNICGSSPPKRESVNNLKLVGMVLNESLRLYSPIIRMSRETCKATKLGDIMVPERVELVLFILAVQHNKDIWGDDACMFKPERFADGVSRASNTPSSFVPFSTGPRRCIGQNFAILEAKIALAMILQYFSFDISPSYRHAPTSAITLQPQFGVPMILKPINLTSRTSMF